jgi:hypothetical protein
VKLAEAEPPGRVTVGDVTISAGESLATEMLTIPLGFATVTVQEEGWLGAVNEVGEHTSDVIVVAAAIATVADFELPL